MPQGETILDLLMQNMSPVCDPRCFMFAHLPSGEILDPAIAEQAIMVLQEKEGRTVILQEEAAYNSGLQCVLRCAMITLNVHASLEAVGFLARIIPALAARGMGVNPVAGYFHDHIFVPHDAAKLAMDCLTGFVQEARSRKL